MGSAVLQGNELACTTGHGSLNTADAQQQLHGEQRIEFHLVGYLIIEHNIKNQ